MAEGQYGLACAGIRFGDRRPKLGAGVRLKDTFQILVDMNASL
jgi:hypothetical protein